MWRVVASVWAGWERHALTRRDRAVSHGIHVRDLLEEPAAEEELVLKLVHALELLGEVDPRRLARLQQDLDAVALLDIPKGIAVFMPGSRTCYITLRVVREYSEAELALVIAHEGTHARLDALRLLPSWGVTKHREEHRCLQEELALAARFPRGQFPEVDRWAAHRASTSRYASKPRRASRGTRLLRAT
jgi:hypothetical protein